MRRAIGIDIGSLYTKVAEIEVGAKLHLKNIFYFFTPYSSGMEKKINHDQLVKEIIKKIPLANFKNSRVGVNTPFSTPVVMTLTLPRMSKKELEIAAITEAKRKMIPTPGPNSTFETLFLGETVETNIPRYEVLIVREEKDFINLTLDLFKDTEVLPALIAPLCTAYGRLLVKDPSLRGKEIAFIDIGYSSMNISISKGINMVFNRNIFYGCKDIISGVSNGLGISSEAAEKILLDKGIPDVDFDPKNRVAIAEEIMRQKYEATMKDKLSGEVNPLELRMFLEPSIERIIQEIRRTFIFFKERYEEMKIEEILFLGGGALIKNLVSTVGKKISPSPKIVSPIKLLGLTFKDEEMVHLATFFSSAISLAFNTTFKTQETINFLPFELKKKEELAIRRSIFGGVCVIVSCVFLLGWLNFWVLGMNIKRSLRRTDFELQRLQDVYEKEKDLSSKMKRIDERRKGIQTLIDNRMQPTPILSELARAKPKSLFFTYLYIGLPQEEKTEAPGKKASGALGKAKSGKNQLQYKLNLKVKVFSDYEGSYRIMKDFISNLAKSGYLTNIELKPPKLEKITPQIEREIVKLTEVTWRDFTVEADLNI